MRYQRSGLKNFSSENIPAAYFFAIQTENRKNNYSNHCNNETVTENTHLRKEFFYEKKNHLIYPTNYSTPDIIY